MSEKFYLPAEWEKHEATWIGWLHNSSDWPGKFSSIRWVYAEIVKYISRGEKVRILVQSKEHKLKAERILKSVNVNLDNVEFYLKKTNRGWLRDSAPAFVKNKNELIAIDFRFNAWAKYDDYKLDDKVPSFISNKLNLKRIVAKYNGKQVVLEGGAIDHNGEGTLITTEECLLSKNVQVRNSGFAKKDYEKLFQNYLGITNVIWLRKGIAGDDTHGHIDDLCRFVNNNTVVLVKEENKSDDNYINLIEDKERLENAELQDGSKPNIVELPMPSPVVFKGQRLPASYANFYISNYAVLVPTFNDPNDRIALGIISELFPDREVIGIHSVDLVWGLGTIHCLTHEQPGNDL
ncbi:MAG TPA: agmatine deiminase family protein [Ignavibacteriales bacterium]|nr:agmatine deiminase family protein [Ignavibacteriales bacterium]